MIHMPKYEKIWMAVGTGSLILFLIVLRIMAGTMGLNPPDGLETTVEPENVEAAAPFDQPGLKQIGPKFYHLYSAINRIR